MDVVNSQIVDPGQRFVKSSMRLLKRCTKPDRKGMLLGVAAAQNSRQAATTTMHCCCCCGCGDALLLGASSLTPAATGAHMHRDVQDRHRHADWLLHHGLHWLLRQADPHPDQQHHRRRVRDRPPSCGLPPSPLPPPSRPPLQDVYTLPPPANPSRDSTERTVFEYNFSRRRNDGRGSTPLCAVRRRESESEGGRAQAASKNARWLFVGAIG